MATSWAKHHHPYITEEREIQGNRPRSPTHWADDRCSWDSHPHVFASKARTLFTPAHPQPIPSPLCHQPGQSTAYNMKGLGSKRKGGLKEKPQAFCTSYSDFLSSPSFSKITQEFHLVHTGCVKHAECLQHAWDFLMLAQEGTRASPSANSLNVLISFTVQWHHGRKRLGKRKGFVWLTLLHRSPSSVEARPCTQVGTWRQELK